MASETIDDIVRKMHDWDYYSHLDECAHREICDFADLIEAAAKAEREVSRNLCNKCEAGDIKAENARLRAELAKARNLTAHPNINAPIFRGNTDEQS